MDIFQNKEEKNNKENINEDLIDLKKEKDIFKSLPSSENNFMIIIKELINSLKEKINIYENQIKKLIDDKVKLQMNINTMILQNLQSKKKNNNNNINNNIDISNNNENAMDLNICENNINNIEKEQNKIVISSLIDINQKLLVQNKELKEQIEHFKQNIDICRQNLNNYKNNKNNVNKCQFCEEKKLELSKMAEEKKEIFSSITSLEKQLDELKSSQKLKKDKKKKREKIKNSESLPNIEQYFILNNKFQLVDSEKNLWHMKKCLKFQDFKKKYEGSNISSYDILKEFVIIYDTKTDEEKSDEGDYLEVMSMSDNENNKKKVDNKYMPPLPGMNNNLKKKNAKKNESVNANVNNNENDNGNQIQEINNSDIQINIDENEIKDNNKESKNEENIKFENNNFMNENGKKNYNSGGLNEIKEETSFNLSDNTE